ncbi:2-amino-4-oxopentanoate thiolase subunit OrtA [Selenihalanaerobacter shriftii]|uniref:2-amino-4-ketopentanoate thiolase alpha subunit n=1 Tax=Selenihalanaerobacter shriftii TaxID=142842 RepID=A0A1T4NCD4_9FIRM|nr:2-amino-4-oxopentanoate thiolase subunit OrtA [Selenihalanaerobacter shriftii]SJZ76930.1 hypothetical protein SAMN02745118_01763 [Selenihalanaerobacter shriftii]
MAKAKKGEWVQIHNIVLKAGERAPNLPEETQEVPLELRVRGFITEDAKLGEEVSIKTLIGRTISGTLEEISPSYEHDFGKPVPELLPIGRELKDMLKGGKE